MDHQPSRPSDPGFARRLAVLEPATWSATARTIDVVWTTGSDVARRDFWTGESWTESLEISADAVDLGRLNAGAPVLNTHSAYSLSDQIGVVERAWLENGQGMATLRLSEREDVAPIAADIAAGIIRNISVGYSVQEWRESREPGQPVRRTAVRWQPMEISFVPIPADANAQTRAAGAEPAPPINQPKELRTMTDTVETIAPAAPDHAAIRTEGAVGERNRAREIRSAATQAGLDAAWADAHIDAGTAPDAARADALARLAASRTPPLRPQVSIVTDEGDTVMRGVEGALMARMTSTAYEGPAEQFRAASLLDLARATLQVRGVTMNGWSRADIAKAALGLPVLGRNMQTASDFAALLANTQSKRLLSQYMMIDRSFLTWCARRSLPDFKTTTIAELGAAPALLALAEGGTIQVGAIQDTGETYNLVRYARNVALSYVAIVNDDLGGFDRMPMAFATAAANLESGLVYGLLETNANMADGVALFAAGHSNTSAQAMTVDGVTALRSLIRRQIDASGQRIMVNPSVLVVPTELFGQARALFSATVVPATVATTAVNPWVGGFTIVESPFLADVNDYYMTVASGTGYEAVEVGYEAGSEGPQLTSYVQPDVDGVVFSLRHSFGAKAATWRTIARATA